LRKLEKEYCIHPEEAILPKGEKRLISSSWVELRGKFGMSTL